MKRSLWALPLLSTLMLGCATPTMEHRVKTLNLSAGDSTTAIQSILVDFDYVDSDYRYTVAVHYSDVPQKMTFSTCNEIMVGKSTDCLSTISISQVSGSDDEYWVNYDLAFLVHLRHESGIELPHIQHLTGRTIGSAGDSLVLIRSTDYSDAEPLVEGEIRLDIAN